MVEPCVESRVAIVTGANHGIGVAQAPLTASTFDQVMAVDARAAALLITEFAGRHMARDGH